MSKYGNAGGGVSGRAKFVVGLVLLLAVFLYCLIAAPSASAGAVQHVVAAVGEFVEALNQ